MLFRSGDEVGLCGFTDPDNRRTFPWGNEDAVMLEFHKEIIKLHKESKALRKGSLKEIKSQYQFISYARFTEEEQVLVLINNNSHALDVELSIWEVGIPFTTTLKCRLETNTEGFYRNSKDCIVTDGKTFVTIGANSGMIFTHSN